jgi:glycine hydroxymethyltransferase
MLVDMTPLKMTGQQAEDALRAAGIILNKNAIPYDPRPPRVTSGVRIGTPAVTSRDMRTSDMAKIAEFILEALRAGDKPGELARIKARVGVFAGHFPVPGVTDRARTAM